MLMNQSLTMDDQSPQIKQLVKMSDEMLQQLIQLIEKGSNLDNLNMRMQRRWLFIFISSQIKD